MIELIRSVITLAASVSCLDLFDIPSQLRQVEDAGISLLHFDVVDGRFNDCIILGTPTLSSLRPHTHLPIEVHLATYKPEKFICQFINAGADYVAVHWEAMEDPQFVFDIIKQAGAQPVLALRAETEAEDSMLPWLAQAAWVLKLTVNPGFSGQALQPEAVNKIKRLRAMLDAAGLKIGIQADGNINSATIPSIIQAGADMLTGGTSGLFVKGKSIAEAADELFSAARRASTSRG